MPHCHKPYQTCLKNKNQHDTGFLSMRETPKQVSFSDEKFPLLSFLKTKYARIQTNNDRQVSVSSQRDIITNRYATRAVWVQMLTGVSQ
jgi:hypothetical protein